MTLVVCRPVETVDLVGAAMFVSALAFAMCGIWCAGMDWWRRRR